MQPFNLQQPQFPIDSSPAYPQVGPPAPQRIGGVPQTLQQGGFHSQFIEAPAGGMRTLVVGGSHPQQSHGRSVSRQRGQGQGQQAPAPSPHANARVTIRKIG